MSAFVQFGSTDEQKILIEVEEADASGYETVLISGIEHHVKKVESSLQESMAIFGNIAKTAAQVVNETCEQAAEYTLDFSLKVSAEGNFFVAKGAGEGTIKVSAKWKRE